MQQKVTRFFIEFDRPVSAERIEKALKGFPRERRIVLIDKSIRIEAGGGSMTLKQSRPCDCFFR